MELWIRSQDKTTLIRSYEIYIAEYGKGSYVIRAKRTSHILGAYNSFKRALEVLDEIQNLIQPSMNFIISQHIDFNNNSEGLIGCNILKQEPKIEKIHDYIVYEMPKD